jgi:hypothetical protein
VKSKLNYLDVACTFPEQHDVHDGQNGEFIRLFKVERNHPRCRTGWKLDTYKIFSKIIDIEIIFVFFFVFFFCSFFLFFFCYFFCTYYLLFFYFFLPLPLPLPLVLYSLGPLGKTSGGVQGRWEGHGLPSYDKPGIRITKVTIYHVLKHFILRMWGKDPLTKYISSMKGLSSRGKKIKEIVEQIIR